MGEACKRFALAHRHKGVCVVISDFFDKGGYENGLRYVAGGKYDLFCVQTLSPQEIEPDLQGDLKLRDMEDDDMAEVSITQPLIKQYKANLNAYCLAVKDYVTRRGGTYLFTSTAVPFDTLVLNYLRERGLLALGVRVDRADPVVVAVGDVADDAAHVPAADHDQAGVAEEGERLLPAGTEDVDGERFEMERFAGAGEAERVLAPVEIAVDGDAGRIFSRGFVEPGEVIGMRGGDAEDEPAEERPRRDAAGRRLSPRARCVVRGQVSGSALAALSCRAQTSG